MTSRTLVVANQHTAASIQSSGKSYNTGHRTRVHPSRKNTNGVSTSILLFWNRAYRVLISPTVSTVFGLVQRQSDPGVSGCRVCPCPSSNRNTHAECHCNGAYDDKSTTSLDRQTTSSSRASSTVQHSLLGKSNLVFSIWFFNPNLSGWSSLTQFFFNFNRGSTDVRRK